MCPTRARQLWATRSGCGTSCEEDPATTPTLVPVLVPVLLTYKCCCSHQRSVIVIVPLPLRLSPGALPPRAPSPPPTVRALSGSMETMSRSVLSPPLVRCGRNPLLFRSRPLSGPSLMRRRDKYQAAVIPFLLQVRAKALSSLGEEKHTSRNNLGFPNYKTEGVKNIYEEICDKVIGMHLVAGVSIAVAFLVAFTHVDSASARSGEIDLPPIEPEVATISRLKEINLAKQLQSIGAKMYGAFWCSHCFEQKQMFGKEALKYIEYLECYPEGYRRGVKLAAACSAANIRGFPTWVINGQQYSGEQGFDRLAELSGLTVAQVLK